MEAPSISIILPTFISCTQVREALREVCGDWKTDFLQPVALGKHLTDKPLLCWHVSQVVSKGWLSLSSDSTIPNCALCVLTSTEIVLLKENWAKWVFAEDPSLLSNLRDSRPLDLKFKAALEGVLSVTWRHRLDEITDFHASKGGECLLELEFSRGQPEKLLFLCDFGRQRFLQTLIRL